MGRFGIRCQENNIIYVGLPYAKECEMIEKILINNDMIYYKYDNEEK